MMILGYALMSWLGFEFVRLMVRAVALGPYAR
jgi:hypothetical protein